MAGKKLELGMSGGVVAANVTRFRESAGLNYTELSKRLIQRQRDISALAVRRIEEGDRRVDIDDLVALAVALDISPITLLMPKAQSADELVPMAGGSDEQIKAGRMWNWLAGRLPLPDVNETAELAHNFVMRAVPGWLIRKGEITVVESGLEPNVTASVRWLGGEHILHWGPDVHD